MKDVLVFDWYTAQVFGFILISLIGGFFIILLTRKFPSFMTAFAKVIYPLLILGVVCMCSLQVAKGMRLQAKWDAEEAKKP